MNLTNKRRMASEVLGIGESRVWIDPMRMGEAAGAITKNDVRKLVSQGVFRAIPVQGISKARARIKKIQRKKGRSMGVGRRKGTRNARTPKKESWAKNIRAVRGLLREYKGEKKIDAHEYRKLYDMADSGSFKTKTYVKLYIRKMKEKKA